MTMLPGTLAAKQPRLRPGIPVVDWTNPITRGLLACFVPGAFGAACYNIGPVPFILPALSGTTFADTPEGIGVKGIATNTGLTGPAPTALRLATAVSIFWRGLTLSTPTDYSNFFSTSYTNSSTSPYNAYWMGASSVGTTLVGGVDTGGGDTELTGNAIPIGAMWDCGLSWGPSGGALFQNGASVATSGTAMNATYGAPYTSILAFVPGDNVATNSICTVGCIWSRPLSAAEQASLHRDPYQFLLFPGDLVVAQLKTPSHTSSALPVGVFPLIGGLAGLAARKIAANAKIKRRSLLRPSWWVE